MWKTLFCAALAVTAFSACSDDDKDDDGGMPSITVNGEASVTVAVKLDGGTTDAIEVVSSGNWELTFDDETATWCHPSKETGGKGKTTLTFTVDKWEGAASTDSLQVTAK
ncbi:MAG: BACON domain-containing protein, partial [Escherichia coli]|nr:BACON domain-containing protein [Escherichia coli]